MALLSSSPSVGPNICVVVSGLRLQLFIDCRRSGGSPYQNLSKVLTAFPDSAFSEISNARQTLLISWNSIDAMDGNKDEALRCIAIAVTSSVDCWLLQMLLL
ncbi:unnamed protein product [Linum tenue]|uniref:Uncharacterized protein n=1 Tax=Linum tenue TaxID=586396 RepID=A0AAV0P819_9ROSI|nr:unnamed protein product [Linum tenue]